MRKSALSLILFLVAYSAVAQQRFADIGDLLLDNGQTIRHCRIGYRTFGKLNQQRSNAILVPTWFGGTSQQKSFVANPGGVADSTRFYAIVVDAIGNGVSSSPSNSTAQPGAQFPQFTIRDMVRSQHALVTKTLGLTHLYGIMGISMGGMQSFEWMVTYPDFVDKVVPIVGTPKQSSYDRLFWGTQLAILERGNFSAEAMQTVSALHQLNLSTPGYFFGHMKAEEEPEFVRKTENNSAETDPYNWASQLRAMIGQDIYRGRTVAELKSAIRAKLLVIVATQDHMVTPGPASELARGLQVPLVQLTGECGHLSTSCEEALVRREVTAFFKP